MIDDLLVTIERMGARVGNVLVYRFGVRAGHNVEASVVERRPRNREPESDLRTSAEREIIES